MFIKKIGLTLAINIIAINVLLMIAGIDGFNNIALQVFLDSVALLYFIAINILPKRNVSPTKSLYVLSSGCELLQLFLFSLPITIIIQFYAIFRVFSFGGGVDEVIIYMLIAGVIIAIIGEAFVFWNGMLRVYFTSVQLGIKHRILGALCGWIIGVNIYYLNKIIKICSDEVEYETQKIELNKVRVESEICKTKYPILMVHGVFFRDFRYLNYWGRTPQELQKNGATIFYGEQQSAGTVEFCGQELAEKIKNIVKETGCEKVNIIAHSKGGLDSRVAISNFGASPYVASLTTINTPHQGCLFSEYLLERVPERMKQSIAFTYNTTLLKFGDVSPDFIGAVTDLSASSCSIRNELTPNIDGILYESVGSYCHKARSGRFPLNLSYNIVKHFDGKNDGLVSIESAKWGTNFTLLEPKGKRGISHGDLIDLNRENIKDFDVREFFVELVANLKNRGY